MSLVQNWKRWFALVEGVTILIWSQFTGHHISLLFQSFRLCADQICPRSQGRRTFNMNLDLKHAIEGTYILLARKLCFVSLFTPYNHKKPAHTPRWLLSDLFGRWTRLMLIRKIFYQTTSSGHTQNIQTQQQVQGEERRRWIFRRSSCFFPFPPKIETNWGYTFPTSHARLRHWLEIHWRKFNPVDKKLPLWGLSRFNIMCVLQASQLPKIFSLLKC